MSCLRSGSAALFVLALGAVGCRGGELVNPNPPMSVGAVYTDLPAPEGFVYDKNDSYGNTSPTGAFRVINQVMRGKDRRIEGAVQHFKEKLAVHGWQIESQEGNPPGPVKLAFTRKEERCRIDIRDESASVVIAVLKVNKKD